jgi:hypothetical protein
MKHVRKPFGPREATGDAKKREGRQNCDRVATHNTAEQTHRRTLASLDLLVVGNEHRHRVSADLVHLQLRHRRGFQAQLLRGLSIAKLNDILAAATLADNVNKAQKKNGNGSEK